MIVYQDRFIDAGAKCLAQPGDVGINASIMRTGDRRAGWNLNAGWYGRRRRRLLGEALISSTITVSIPVPVSAGRRRRERASPPPNCRSADIVDVERIYMIADRHADVTGITAQVLAGYHSSAAQGESVGRTQACQQPCQS